MVFPRASYQAIVDESWQSLFFPLVLPPPDRSPFSPLSFGEGGDYHPVFWDLSRMSLAVVTSRFDENFEPFSPTLPPFTGLGLSFVSEPFTFLLVDSLIERLRAPIAALPALPAQFECPPLKFFCPPYPVVLFFGDEDLQLGSMISAPLPASLKVCKFCFQTPCLLFSF